MTYDKIAQQKYNEKIVKYTIRLDLDSLYLREPLERYLQENNISLSGFFRKLVKAELERSGYLEK